MGVWSTYEARLGVPGDPSGDAVRDTRLYRGQDRVRRWVTESLSYYTVGIANGDGEIVTPSFQIAVRDAPEYDIKKVYSMPNEKLPHGKLIWWMDCFWLITEIDYRNEYLSEGKMRQCNYQVKGINDDGKIVTRWAIVEDGTKYLIGEKNNQMMSIGDARVALTIGKDEETRFLRRGQRFLLDDLDTDDVLAYQITKPNRLYKVYNGAGAYRFILNEVQSTDNDNTELRIADYYTWYPRYEKPESDIVTNQPFDTMIEEHKYKETHKGESIEESGVWL